jgi:hypothetical protein
MVVMMDDGNVAAWQWWPTTTAYKITNKECGKQ